MKWAFVIVIVFTGCAVKKPPKVIIRDCHIVKKQDEKVSCTCLKPVEVGVDAKTGAHVIECLP